MMSQLLTVKTDMFLLGTQQQVFTSLWHKAVVAVQLAIQTK
jgi:hypothetical protein